MENKFYVYQYVDPRSLLPFYIGKGSGNRLYVHLSETKENTENRKKYAHIKGLYNKKLEPIIEKIAENLSEEDAYDLETILIVKYGRRDIDPGGILTNICIDNKPPRIDRTGYKHSEETKALLKEQRKTYKGLTYEDRYGVDRAKEIKEKLSQPGELNGFYGKSHTILTREKMSKKAKLRLNTRAGIKHTEETKRKVQLNNPNRRDIHTPEGKFISSEHYAKTINKITANGLRNLLKNCDTPLTKRQIDRNKLFNITHLGKTPRELGYYFIHEDK